MEDLNTTSNKLDLLDRHKTIHSITEEYTFLSSIHGTFKEIHLGMSLKQASTN